LGPVGFTGSIGYTGSEGKILGYGGLESTTANSVSLGRKTFVTNQLGSQLLYLPGTFIEIRSNVYTTLNSMVGVIESFVGNDLETTILTTNGNAPALTQWYINLTGSIGATGPRGASSWTPRITSGIVINDNTDFSKTTGNTNVWSDRVYSVDGFEGASCSAQAANFDHEVMFGITSNLSISRPIEDMEYAFRFNVGRRGQLELKSNTDIIDLGLFDSFTRTQIVCDKTTVKFYVDSTMVHVSNRTSSGILHFDSAFYNNGSGLINVAFGPLGYSSNSTTRLMWTSPTLISGIVTPNWNNGNVLVYTLSDNIILSTPTNMPIGESMTIVLQQDSAGNRTMSASSSIRFDQGNQTLSTAPDSIDVIEIFKLTESIFLATLKNYQ